MIRPIYFTLLIALSLCTVSVQGRMRHSRQAEARHWADSVLATMSDDEKIGQLFVYTTRSTVSEAVKSQLMRQVRDNHVGGLLFWKGTAEGQAELTNLAQTSARIPLLITMDGEWGLQMRLNNTLRYPRKLTMSAMTRDSLIYEFGAEVGRQCRLMGIHMTFDPVLDVNLNPRNPVINVRAFGDDPEIITQNASAFVAGMHSQGILCMGKHFPGHGDTETDTHNSLAVVTHTRDTLEHYDLYPYRRLIKSHQLDGIMVGHLIVPSIDSSGMPASLSPRIINDVLRGELRFNGLVMTDAMKMGAVLKTPRSAVLALQAGEDMILDMGEGNATDKAISDVRAALADSTLTMDFLEEKVRRILITKYLAGAHHFEPIDVGTIASRLNTPHARLVQQEMGARSVTLLKNKSSVLPFRSLSRNAILVTLDREGATYFSSRCLHYENLPTYNLSSSKGEIPAEVDSALASAKEVILAIHDDGCPPSFLERVGNRVEGRLIQVYFLSPYVMSKYASAVDMADAVVIGYENAQCMQEACASALYGGATVTGRLPVAIDGLWDKNAGLTVAKTRLGYSQPEAVGLSSDKLEEIDRIVEEAIEGHATPGCQVLVARRGQIVYQKAFGTKTYSTSKVQPTDLYDLASVTKLMATVPAIMKLVDEGKVDLEQHVTAYVPELHNLRHVTVRELLMHQSGLPASRPFYMQTVDASSYTGKLYSSVQTEKHPVQVDKNTYANPSFRYRSDLVSDTADAQHRYAIADSLYILNSFPDTVTAAISRVRAGEKTYVYSDINFMVLQRIVERVSGDPLDRYCARRIYAPIGASSTTFRPRQHTDTSRIVPTADDRFLRHELLVGYVHDENAAFQGGVSGHAGLFSNAEDLAKLCQTWMNGGIYGGERLFSPSLTHRFLTAKSEISRRGLGFDRTKIEESPTRERVMIGHTGFTGTCVWMDPSEELIYVFLSNRVHPNAWDKKLVTTNVRTRIASVIYQAIIPKK
ncbi:MAG: serine hydrolase [Paludibacteraceae bacterium]|nr:serine hydrolase [Paludibacteraceae bacterium]